MMKIRVAGWVLSLVISVSLAQPGRARTIYVDADAPGANDGTSWGECRYCDISKADCPERIDIATQAVTDHNLF
ncbi:MAG: hypothetical protein JSU70_04600 [Phycisphaerales bacterium]|nr:MAG: hypothetical protein JSU70_04600 [Phycisphaerales bacterium]